MIHRVVQEKLGEIEALCRELEVDSMELFGSATTEEFDPASSDLDFLVVLRKPKRRNVVDQYFDLKDALEKLFNRSVDLVEVRQVKNPFVIHEMIRKQRALVYFAA